MDAAKFAVMAAEAGYGRGGGADKLVYALKALKDKGYNIETQEVLDAIEAAWQKLDIDEYAAGIKKIE